MSILLSVGESYNDNDINENECPCCGELSLNKTKNIVFGNNTDDIGVNWVCRNCDSKGRAWYSVNFYGHMVDSDESAYVSIERKIENHLFDIFTRIGMDKPDNFDEMVGYIRRDIEETADKDFTSEDVVIGFRRFIQSI